jgi:hypothetical protein
MESISIRKDLRWIDFLSRRGEYPTTEADGVFDGMPGYPKPGQLSRVAKKGK